jgi:AcrR family transcriptional regulator
MRMGRPVEYDRDTVLDAALFAFWKSGHAACSLQMLVDATGLSRQSIYNAFGDKDGLFREVLDHYTAKVAVQCEPLEALTADQNSLREFITNSIFTQRNLGPGACFIVVTAFSPQALDPKIKPALDAGAEMVRAALATCMRNTALRGDPNPPFSPEDGAAHLYAVMNGLSALAQTGGSNDQVETALNLSFQTLFPKIGS